MPKFSNVFTRGRMNKTADERLVPKGEYVDALNIRVNSTEDSDAGTVENSLGNTKLSTLTFLDFPLSDAATCIGSFADSARETIYWFVTDQSNTHSDTGRVDMIVSRNMRTNELKYHVVSIETLNFSQSWLINQVSMVEDLLFWTDDLNPPRKININRSYAFPTSSGTPLVATSDNITDEDINVIVAPPVSAPGVTLATTSGEESFLETKIISFAYRYKYLDGEYSALSQFTEVAFQPGPFRLNPATLLNDGMVNIYNTAFITINTGGSNVVGVDVCFKLADSNVINVIDKYDKAREGWSDDSSETIVFKNSKIFTTLPSSEILRLFDNVPKKAKAQTIIGRRLVYGNYVDGYDLKDSNDDDVRLTYSPELVSETIGFQDYSVTASQAATYTIDGTETHDGAFTIDFDGLPLNEGVTLTIQINLSHSGFSGGLTAAWGASEQQEDFSIEMSFTFPRDYTDIADLVFSDEFQQKVGTFAAYFESPSSCDDGFSLVDAFHCAIDPVSGFTVASSGRTALDQGFKIEFGSTASEVKITVNAIQYENGFGSTDGYEYFEVVSAIATSTLVGDKRSLHSNRDYDLAIIYMDDYNRATTALTSKNNTVFVKPQNSITANSIRVTIPPTMKPPSWATRYKWALKPSKGNYETIYGRIFYRDNLDGSVWIRLEGESQNKIEVGDKLIVKRDSVGPVTDLVTTKVLDKEAKAENFISGDSITQVAGVYARFRPSGWSAIYDEDSFVDGGTISGTTDDYSPSSMSVVTPLSGVTIYGPGDFPFIEYPLHDISSGTYTSWDIPAGSVVRIRVEFIRNEGPSSCTRQECILDKEIIASDDYTDFKSFFDNEYIDVDDAVCLASSGAANDNVYNSALYDLDTDAETVFTARNGTSTRNRYQFVTDSSLTGSPLWLIIRGGTRRCVAGFGERNSSIKAEISITKANATFIFETEPQDATPDVFYEGSEVFSIEDGNHLCNVTDQDLSTSTSGVSDLAFFDCFTFGNGAESYKVEDSIVGNYFLLGQRVTSVSSQDYREANRFASLTYSGVYNQESNVNRLNEFNLGLLNFKDIEQSYGEIGIIQGRATDLLVLQEDKIGYVLVGKNLISDSTDGGAIASVPEVLGTYIARSDQYGISLNPESFSEYGAYKFFTDAKRNSVIMLYGGGYGNEQLRVISNDGMREWFRDLFQSEFNKLKIGAYDPYSDEYVLFNSDINIPEDDDCVPCGTIIRQYNEAPARRTICVDLGTGTGEVSIDYRILDPETSLVIQVTYDGVDYTTGVVTSDGSLTINKTESTPRTAEVEIVPGGSVSSYEVVLNCPSDDAMSVIMVVLTSNVDAGDLILAEFDWSSADYDSPVQSETITAASGSGSIVSLNKTFTAAVGTGMVPPDGSTVNMRVRLNSFYDFVFPDNGDFLYLKTNSSYDLSTATGISNLLSAATSLSPLDSSGAPSLYEDSFTVPSGSEARLYLVYDLRRVSELLMCYNPINRNDYSGAESVCCNCETSDGATYKPFSGSDPYGGGGASTAACADSYDTNIWYHDGSGLEPSIGDTVYEDSSGTTYTPLATAFIKISDDRVMQVSTAGEITDIQDC